MSDEPASGPTLPTNAPVIRSSRRWLEYLNERFPILAHGLLVVSLYLSHQFLADTVTRPDAPMRIDPSTFAGCIVLFCFFLHLRVFDDFKDYSDDCRHFPERVLSRGQISLQDLQRLAAIAICVEILLSALRGPATLLSLLLVCAYSILMAREFFARQWLKRHFVIYAATHLVIVPLLSLFMFSFATGSHVWHAPGSYWMYSLATFFAASDLEISRKIRDPLHELPGVDSYTRRFGVRGAGHAVLLVRTVYTLLLVLVARHLPLPPFFFVALGTCFVASLTTGVQYVRQPSQGTAQRMEISAALYVLSCHLLLAFALAVTYGIIF